MGRKKITPKHEKKKNQPQIVKDNFLFHFVLFYFILFYFILFYFILFYFIIIFLKIREQITTGDGTKKKKKKKKKKTGSEPNFLTLLE